MRRFVWILLIALVVLHQDNWFWTDDRLVLGIVPIGLFYHALISIAAAVTWFLATRHAWPALDRDLAAAPSEDQR